MSAATLAAAKVITFGCRLNAYESEVMREHAAAAGLSDAVIVNTCAVTAEAERQARQAIRRARREHPGARLIVTGCAAQIDPASYAAMPEVDQVLGNAEKLHRTSFDPASDARVRVADIMIVRETAAHLISGFAGRTRAFVEVQQGCNHRCTFCVIPYGRGNNRSVPIGEIVARVRTLVAEGTAEVVLTGVDIASFGGDLPGQPGLGQMVRRLLRLVPELPRLRLSSLDPAVPDMDLLRVLAEEPRLMPHLHLSLQAGDDLILKRMKRRHLRADALRLCEAVRRVRPDVVFGADLIAGFPTEDAAMFENTAALIADCDLTYVHVFPYSRRPGTPAARIPDQVPVPVRKARAESLRRRGAAATQRYLTSRIGGRARVLVEKAGFGHCEHFAPVAVAGGAPGKIVDVPITGVADGRLQGRPGGG